MMHSTGAQPADVGLDGNSSVCVVVPVRNGADFLEECLQSVLDQDYDPALLCVSVFNDGSTDSRVEAILEGFREKMRVRGIQYLVTTSGPCECTEAKGVGGARNAAIRASASKFLVFLDADDVMMGDRVSRQVRLLESTGPTTVIGGNFDRIPSDATPRYREYHSRLPNDHDELFRHAFRDAPLVMPTIACYRKTWEAVGGFEEGPGIPEDLFFIYRHLQGQGRLAKVVGDPVIRYRYHPAMTSHGLDRRVLLRERVRAFEQLVLFDLWRDRGSIMIWGAGRDGRAFFRFLSRRAKSRVAAFCDVDVKKIGSKCHDRPVVSIKRVTPPFVTCVALDRTGGAFENNLSRTGFTLGEDFFYIS